MSAESERKNIILYDLETNGLDYRTTGIMQMAIMSQDIMSQDIMSQDIMSQDIMSELTEQYDIILNKYVYPFDDRVDGTEIHGIDRQKLIDNNAISTVELCKLVKDTLRTRFGREDVYFLAYNNFGYDQIILENNFKISNIKMPSNWYFIDLFPLIKEAYPQIKPNFKLATAYKILCADDSDIQFHCALADTTCLYHLLNYVKADGKASLLDKYTRPLLQDPNIKLAPIHTLNGYFHKIGLERKGFVTIGDMYKAYAMTGYDSMIFKIHLQTNYNILYTYFIDNMIKNLDMIRYLGTNTVLGKRCL